MKDAFGTPLKVGQRVVVAAPSGAKGYTLWRGTIHKLTQFKALVLIDHHHGIEATYESTRQVNHDKLAVLS